MKSNPILRGLPALALAALALAPTTNAAVTVEAYDTTTNPTTEWGHFTTIPNLSATDYVDASQSTWTYVAFTSYTSDTGQSFTPVTLANNLPVSNLNNGVGQTSEWDIPASNWGFNHMTIDLGSVVNVAEFNSYSWVGTDDPSRQDQGYTLYYSAAGSAPSTAGNLVDNGWVSLGTVATTYWADTGLGHQIGASFSDTGGTLASARFLLMQVDLTNGFFGEVDVVVAAGAPADAATSTVDSSPATVANDGVSTSTVTVTLNDAGSSPVAGKTVTLASDRGGLDTISAASGPSDGSGVVTFAVSSTTAGSPVFTATDTTDSVVVTDTASVTFTASGAVSAATSTVGASPAAVAADGATTSTITVTLKDGSSNPVAGKTVTLASDRGATDTISAASGPSDGSGEVTFTVNSATAGDAVFTATDTADSVVVAQTATVTFETGAADDGNSAVSASPSSVPANGVNTSKITVTLQDSNGNPVVGNTVTLASARGATDTISAASGPSNAAGEVTFTVSSSTTGSAIFTATDTTDAGVLSQTATVSFTPPSSGVIVTVESFDTGAGEQSSAAWSLPTRNPSNSDYLDASQSTWTDRGSDYTSDAGMSITPYNWANNYKAFGINDGVAQVSDWDVPASRWGTGFITLDLGSVVDVSEFNTYSWSYQDRQDQVYSLYSSAAGTAPSTSGDLVANGWTLVGDVATTFMADTGNGHQVGVSFTGMDPARFLLMQVTSTDGFIGEIDVFVLPPVARIRSFGIPGSDGVIDQSLRTIALKVPFGTNLATLAPDFTLSSGTCDQTSGAVPTPDSFADANPVTYTVTDTSTDPDTVNAYTVTVTVAPEVGSLVIDLGAGTVIEGGTFGSHGTNLPLPPLPVGSILRSIAVDTVLEATDNDNFASDLSVLLDPTPGTPGGDFSVEITNGTAPLGGGALNLDWPAGADVGPVNPLVDNKTDADWAAAGMIDLNSSGLFLGNAFGGTGIGGTWSGTITLTYDLVTGTPYGNWAGDFGLSGGDANPAIDVDLGGLDTGIEWVVGGNPSVGSDDAGLAPTADNTSDVTYLLYTYRLADAAAADANTTVKTEYGTNLINWNNNADDGAADEVITDPPVDVPGEDYSLVTVRIPKTLAVGGMLYARLNVTITP